jgi:hypothetical protein
MSRECRALVVRTEPKRRVCVRLFRPLSRKGEALSRIEAARTYARAAAIGRRKDALCIDKIA